MKLIVGLGNPGRLYRLTRHNLGFLALDNYIKANRLAFKVDNKSEICIHDDVIYLKPMTYMNESGSEVGRIVRYYKINLEDILVIHDDKDINFGQYKLKGNGSSGGHNGVHDISEKLGSQDYLRLKVGINNERNYDTSAFVLSKFSRPERKELPDLLDHFNHIIDDFVKMESIELMNKYN